MLVREFVSMKIGKLIQRCFAAYSVPEQHIVCVDGLDVYTLEDGPASFGSMYRPNKTLLVSR